MNNLVVCPSCNENGKKQILGSIDEKGYVYIRRFKMAGGTTVVYATQGLTIMCTCGYGTVINPSLIPHNRLLS